MARAVDSEHDEPGVDARHLESADVPPVFFEREPAIPFRHRGISLLSRPKAVCARLDFPFRGFRACFLIYLLGFLFFQRFRLSFFAMCFRFEYFSWIPLFCRPQAVAAEGRFDVACDPANGVCGLPVQVPSIVLPRDFVPRTVYRSICSHVTGGI